MLICPLFGNVFKVDANYVIACYEMFAVELNDGIPIFTDNVIVIFTAAHSIAIQPNNFATGFHNHVLPINSKSVFTTSLLASKD
ncbi:hypothetical protein C6496_07100 [Candidatus Poribacteria bacterium]|nr:MAG: hypothetical protein C6496_07100 [Candidatus Poribacteria bacterium]